VVRALTRRRLSREGVLRELCACRTRGGKEEVLLQAR
jgi:hypothetical protein